MKNMIVSCHNHNGPKKVQKEPAGGEKDPWIVDCGRIFQTSIAAQLVLSCFAWYKNAHHIKLNLKNDVEGVGGSKYWRLQ